MPPVLIGAGIAAAGAIGSAVISSGASKSAAKTVAKSADQQILNDNSNRDYQYSLNTPTINQGQQASDLYSNFVGVNGGGAAAEALGTFRGSTGYQDLMSEGLRSVNSNVYARGLGDSGAALKALQDRGTGIADRSAQQWLGNVGQLASRGDQARGLVAGIGLNTVNSNNNALQNAADASGNARLVGAQQTNSAIQNLLNIGGSLYGSSYGNNSAITNASTARLNDPSRYLIANNPGYF